MEELIKQAEDGNVEAQYQLGLAYYNGDGIKQNNNKAYYWFQKAIEQGCVEAKSWVDKMIRIHVLIDGERYPMVVKRTDEFLYREVAKSINERLNVYRESYPDIGIAKHWAMTAYDFAFEAITYKNRNDTQPYRDKLEELGKELDKLLN